LGVLKRFVIVVAVLFLAVRFCGGEDEQPVPLQIVTFNIENFPKSTKQIAGAFEEIKRLDAPIVAVQEITNSEVFISAAQRRLGPSWHFESIETGSVLDHRLGVLFDTRRVTYVKTRVHDDTRLEGQQKPVLDVELVHEGRHLRVLVVHLKAGGENHPVRRRQYAALKRVIARVKKDAMPIVLLGDFNATGDADREDLARVELTWLTQPLECSAFWSRDDGCPRSRLDHVLSTQPALEVRAAGGCAESGCAWQHSCPVYAQDVSDHCPVLVEIMH
jgi:endonuclease/exonuclease/phosphatase family metal-dependent hydrolase